MTRFWSFFLAKRSFTVFLMLGLIAGGIFAVASIPKESSPEVQIPLGIVTTILPGASSEDVERLVTDKIEDNVLGLENVSKVTSTSGDGVSTVSVEFTANADIDKSIQKLRDAVSKAKGDLPTEAEDPIVSDVNFADQPILTIAVSGDLAPGELTALGQSLKDDLGRVSGVSAVDVSGVEDRQVQVVVEQDKLAQYGLSLSDVTSAIRAAGVASPAGAITVDGIDYAVRLDASATSTEDIADIALAGPGGASLRVADVATVVDGLADATTFSRVSVAGAPSKPALTLSIHKSRGANILSTVSAVKAKLAELQNTTLSGTQTVVSFDAAKQIKSDLTELSRTGLETVVLVLIILFCTLGLREALVSAASIPLSFLIAFIGLYASGNTINFISLFSLILAIGILVDSGIVVVEAFHTHLRKGDSTHAAAVSAIREYAWPLIAGTLTTIAVFVPLFFLSGIVGKFISSIPFTVIFVLVASIFVALGLVPYLAMRFVHPTQTAMQERQEHWNEVAKARYEVFLRDLLENPKKGRFFTRLMVLLFVVALALPISGLMKVAFFPQDDSDIVLVDLDTPQGTELAKTDLSAREVEEILYQDPRIASFVTEVGAGNAFGASVGAGSKKANVTINLKEEYKSKSQEIVRELRQKFDAIQSAHVAVALPAGGPPTGSAIEIDYSGDDLSALGTAVDQGARILSDIPGTANVTTSTKDDGAEFVLTLDTAKAAELGVSSGAVADTLRTALYGQKATSIREGKQDIEVHTKLDLNPAYASPSETNAVTIDAIRNLPVMSTSGPVPLSSVADITYQPAHASVSHENGIRTATLTADLAQGGNARDITAKFQKAVAGKDITGVTMKVAGETEDTNKSFIEMIVALLAGAALMLSILILEFNSFRLSFYLLSIIPLSLIGVFAGLTLTGQPLSFPSMLGVIALAGVIINHAIILMDSIARIHREEPELSVTDTVIKAASTRLRPIVLTTVTTVIGMLPLAFASSLWGPLAFSIMFGLAFSMILTLVLIPVLYNRNPGKAFLQKHD